MNYTYSNRFLEYSIRFNTPNDKHIEKIFLHIIPTEFKRCLKF